MGTAWEQGYQAAFDDYETGETTSNPYTVGSANYSDWTVGYADGNECLE